MSNGSFRILVDANNDPEFSVYMRNLVKEYLSKADPEKIQQIVAELISDGKPAWIKEEIKKQISLRVEKTIPVGYYTQTKQEKVIVHDLDELYNQVLKERIEKIISGYSDDDIKKMVRDIVEKSITKAFKSKISKAIG
jgi:hypothetical protein